LGNSLQNLILKKPITTKKKKRGGGGVAQDVGLEFKPQYCQKRKYPTQKQDWWGGSSSRATTKQVGDPEFKPQY
jgi:hypothetical protein